MKIEAVLSNVREFAQRKGWKPARLATEARLHPNTLLHMDSPSWSPTANTLRKLEVVIAREEDETAERAA